MVVLLVFSGLAEGLGFFALVPVLQLSSRSGTEDSVLMSVLSSALEFLHIPFTLGAMLLLVVGMMALKAVLFWMAMRQLGYTVADLTTELRLRLIRALLQASWPHFVSRPAGQYANAISFEAHRAVSVFRQGCAILAAGVRVLAYGLLAFLLSWQVAAAAIVVAGFTLVVLKGFFRIARQAGEAQTAMMSALVARLAEALPGIKPIKAMARERFLLPILESEAEEINVAVRNQVSASESMRSFHEPIVITFLAMGLYGAVELAELPFPNVIVMAAIFYRLVTTINQLQLSYQDVAVGESAFWSIRDQIDAAEAMRENADVGDDPPRLSESIRFDSVWFGYEDQPVLTDVSFEIPAGSFFTIVGPSGAGKTTLLDLLVGLRTPSEGEVLLDGVPLSALKKSKWRNQIGYVPQETVLFRGTVLDNVRLGDTAIPEDRVIEALQKAGAWDFVTSHPDGIHRVIGEAGGKLSGGQRQRIAIARALVGEPRLLIFDEATTALDPVTEREVCDSLVRLKGDTTILAVSHQQALRDVADRILELRSGTLGRPREEPSGLAIRG